MRNRTQFELTHFPWLAPRTEVTVVAEGEERVLRVVRKTSPELLFRWTVRYKLAGARRIHELVNELSMSFALSEECPRRHGKDGVFWIVTAPQHGLMYGMELQAVERAEPKCKHFEVAAAELMRMARLDCSHALLCLRPEEVATRRLACNPGPEGDVCRLDNGGTKLHD